jgi:hypothetical protein
MGKFNSAKQFINQIFSTGAGKATGTGAINTTKISKNLKEFQKHKDDIIKSTDKYTKGLTDEDKIKMRGNVSSTLSKLSKVTQQKPKFNKGGRVGLKGGNGFPDLSGDGKTTFKDILIGRGVIKKNKKKMVAKKSKTPMDKAVRKDKKNKRFV